MQSLFSGIQNDVMCVNQPLNVTYHSKHGRVGQRGTIAVKIRDHVEVCCEEGGVGEVERGGEKSVLHFLVD